MQADILYFFEQNFSDKTFLIYLSGVFSFGLFFMFMVRSISRGILPEPVETRLKDFLPFRRVLEDGKTVECLNNTYIQVFKIDGLNTIFANEKDREQFLYLRQTWIDSLSDFNLHARVYTVRRRVDGTQTQDHENPILKEIEDRWDAKMASVFENNYYITLSTHAKHIDDAMKLFEGAVGHLKSLLGKFNVSVLIENSGDLKNESIFSFYANLSSPLTRPNAQAGLSSDVEDINTLLTADNVLFRRDGIIEYSAGNRIKYCSVVGMRRAPDYIDEQMYSDILNLNAELYILRTIDPIPHQKAMSNLISNKKMSMATSFSYSTVEQFDEALEDLEQANQEYQTLVNYSETYFLFGDTEEELNEVVLEFNKICRGYGMTPVQEGWISQASWFNQFPTYSNYPRQYKLLSKAAACAINFEKLPTGFLDNDWGKGAVSQFPTSQGTVYQFQFHTSSAAAAPGHTIAIGPTGKGKTTLYSFLAGQSMRYPDLKVFFFDRHRGAEIFTHAVGGNYLTFGGKLPDQKEEQNYGKQTFLNPLRIEDTPENRAFLRQWLSAITYSDDATAEDLAKAEEEIARAVTTNFDYLDPKERMLKNLYKSCFTPNGYMRREMNRWVDEEQYGTLFNSENDTLDLSSQLTTFDFTYIFEDKRLAPAVINYIMRRIQTMTGKSGDPSLIIIDETAPMLEHPMFRKSFVTGLQEGRKKRQSYLAAFQQPNIIDKLGVGEAVRGQAQTVVFFRNPQATMDDYAGWNLTEKEFAFIQGKLYPELKYAILLSRPATNESLILNVDLSGIGEYLQIFNSGRKQVLLAEELRQKHGDQFVREYLKKVS